MNRSALTALLLLTGCAAHGAPGGQPSAMDAKQAAELASTLKGLTPGTPVQCIQQTRVTDMHKFPDMLVYEYSGREKYVNKTAGGCFGLKYGDIVVTRTISGELCSGDIIQTVSPNSRIPSGSCALTDFIPYRRP
jgi:hypothetical protein